MACPRSLGSLAGSLCHTLSGPWKSDDVREVALGLVGFLVLGKLFVMGLAVGALTWGAFVAWLILQSCLWKRSNCWKEEGSLEQTGWSTGRYVSLMALGGIEDVGCGGAWGAWTLEQGEEPESLLPCQLLTAEPGVCIVACSWVIPELLGLGTTSFLDAALSLSWAQTTPFGHTQGWDYVYLAEPHVRLTCCPVSMANAGSFGGIKDWGSCVTLSPQSIFPASSCLWFRILKSDMLPWWIFLQQKFWCLFEHM